MKSAFLLTAVLFLTFASCKKDKDCTGVVTVQDSTGKLLTGATVRLFAGDINVTETSDAVGQATFVFQNPAILDIEASHPDYNHKATGMITLEEGERVKQTVRF